MTDRLGAGRVGEGGGGTPSGSAGGINVEGTYPDGLEVVSVGIPPNHTIVVRDQASLGTPVADGVRVATVSGGGSYTGVDGEYPATQVSTSGGGTGAAFVVVLKAGAVTAVACVTAAGTLYAVSDTITLLVAGPTQITAAVIDVSLVSNVITVDFRYVLGGPITLDPGVGILATDGGITTFKSSTGLESCGFFGDVAGPMISGTATLENLFFENVHASGTDLHIFNTVGFETMHLKQLTVRGTAAGEIGPIIAAIEQQSFVFDGAGAGLIYRTSILAMRIFGGFFLRSGVGFIANDFLASSAILSSLQISENTIATSDAAQRGYRFAVGMTVRDGGIVVGNNSVAAIGAPENIGKLIEDGPGFLDPFTSLAIVSEGNNTEVNWGASAEAFVFNTVTPIAWTPAIADIDAFEVLKVDNGASSVLSLSPTTARRFALVFDALDTVSVNAGGTYTGLDGNYEATQQSTSGVGVGAVLTVTVTAGSVVAVVSVDAPGSGYAVGDTITLDIAGLTETVAAVLDVDIVTWYLEYMGPRDGFVFDLPWTFLAISAGGARAVAVKYEVDRGGLGVWADVDGLEATRLQADITNRASSFSETSSTRLNTGDRLRLVSSCETTDLINIQKIRLAPENR